MLNSIMKRTHLTLLFFSIYKRIKKYSIETSLFLFLFASRIIKLLNYSTFEADEARDILVARHMSLYDDVPKIGHHMAGINNFYFSLNYYRFISLLTSIKDNPYFIYLSFSVLSIVAGILLFFAIKDLLNKKVAALLLFFYTVSPVFINAASVWGSYASFSLNLISFFFLVKFIKKRNFVFFLIHLFLFGLTISFEFSGIPICLLYIFLLSRSYKEILGNSLLYFVLFLSFNWGHFVYFRSDYSTVFMDKYTAVFHGTNYPAFLADRMRLLYILIQETINITFSSGPLLVAFITLLCSYVLLNKKYAEHRAAFFIVFSYIWILINACSLVFPSKIWNHHLLTTYMLIYLGLSILLSELKRGYILLIVAAIILQIYFYKNIKPHVTFPKYNSLREFDLISDKLNKHLSKKRIGTFSIVQNDTQYKTQFPVPEIYYFLERKRGKLINVTSATQFNMPEITKQNEVFFVCRHYTDNLKPNLQPAKCLELIQNLYGEYRIASIIHKSKYVIVYHLVRS